MDFAEAKAHATGVLFNDELVAELVTYTPYGGVGVEIFAKVIYGSSPDTIVGGDPTWKLPAERDVRPDFSKGNTRNVATVAVQSVDVVAPAYRDEIIVDGVVWVVREGI